MQVKISEEGALADSVDLWEALAFDEIGFYKGVGIHVDSDQRDPRPVVLQGLHKGLVEGLVQATAFAGGRG